MSHESAIREIRDAERACRDAEKNYKKVTEKHFPVGCTVRWRQWLKQDEFYFCTGNVEAPSVCSDGGTVNVRNQKTGKLRQGLSIIGYNVRRLDGES